MLRNYPSNQGKKSTSSHKQGSASCSKENPTRSTLKLEFAPRGSERKLLSEKRIPENQAREDFSSVNKRLFQQEEDDQMKIESCDQQNGLEEKINK